MCGRALAFYSLYYQNNILSKSQGKRRSFFSCANSKPKKRDTDYVIDSTEEMANSNRITSNRRVLVSTILLYCLILVVCFLAGSSDAVNPTKIVCKNRDKKPAIKVEKCKPSFSTKRAVCEKLIRKCKCQHNIELKWTGKGCPGTRGEGVRVFKYLKKKETNLNHYLL